MARFDYEDAPKFEKNKKNNNRRDNEKSRDMSIKSARRNKEAKRYC
jgi:hypothetical protein